MKRLLIWLIAILYGSLAIASNTITLSSVSGTPQTEVEVVVSLNNTNAIVALEMVLPLGEHLSYVTNSAVLATARSNGHMLSAAQVGQELRIYVYSFSQNALNGNTGELLTFRLQLGNEPADYALAPTVVLSDAAGASIDGSVQAGSVAIQAPKLQIVNTQIDYGHIPIREVYTQELFLENVGNLPLVIEDITTTDPLLMPLQTALTIEAGQTASVSIEYAPVMRGAISKEVLVKSNAINGEQLATILADPFSVNELHVGSASGIADSVVTISLTMNNMEPIVAMQCAFVLPEQLEYVANSLVLNSTRSNGHIALSTVNKFVEKQNQWYDSKGDTLVLMFYSMTNQPLLHNDGEIATFQLRLNGNSGGYGLYPQDVVLSNITEENMVSATYEGWVNIQSPSLYGTDDLQFGNCPITETAIATYSFNNYGDAPLQIERVTFLAEGYRVVTPLPLVVNPWEEGSLQIAYDPKSEGDFSTIMNIYTNDPTNRLKTVALSGTVYEPNSLTLTGQSNQDSTYTLSVGLENYTDIVAVQYDVHWRSDMTTSQSAFTPSMRMRNHNYNVIPLDEDSYRIIIYSLSNAKILGNEGELNQLIFSPQEDNSTHQLISKKQMASSQIGVLDCENAKIPIDYVVDTSKDIKVVFKMTVDYCENETGLGNAGAWAGGMSSWFNADRQTFNILCGDVVDDYAFDYTYGDAIEVTMTNGYYEFKNSQGGYKKIEFEPQNLYCSNSLVFCDNPCAWKGSVYYVKIYEDGQLVRNYLPQSDGTLKDIISGTIANPEFGTTTYREELSDGDPSGDGEQGGNQGGNPIDKEQCYSTITIDNIVLSNANGTDKSSAKNVSLVAEQMKWGEETVTACDEYVWNGKIYTQSGVYIDTIPSAQGCDSIVTLHLTINQTKYAEETIIACDSYYWNEETYTESGDYTFTTASASGCDSIVTLHLTINFSEFEEITQIACDSFSWNDSIYYESGDYTYTTETAEGCIRTEVLHLIIGEDVYTDFYETACDSYEWYGDVYTKSGDYTYYFGTQLGCDSIEILHLTINYSDTLYLSEITCDSYTWHGNTYHESGIYQYDTLTVHGCDSVEILNLTINYSEHEEFYETACDSYEWHGAVYTESGNYEYRTTTAEGCERLEVLHLTINRSERKEYTVTACDSYEWHGVEYTTSGTYEYQTQTIHGCDSLEILTLTIHNSVTQKVAVTVCDSYTWDDQKTYTESGTYYQYLQTVNGCDSTVVLHLTINRTKYTEETAVACDSYTWNGETYTQSGEYVYNTTAANGCDSIVTLHLTINKTKYAEETIVACDSYTWNGETYTTSGEYVYNTTAANGCDSIVTLYLTINQTQYTEETIVACDSYTWNGETYTTSGEYVYTTVAANGCDSIVTLHLTINKTKYAEETIVACDSYTWNGETYTESGEYTYNTTAANGCDSIVTLHLTINATKYTEETVTACDSYVWNGETYTESGEYTYTTIAANNGCDSIVTLHLTINRSITTEETEVVCDSYTWTDSKTYTESGTYYQYLQTIHGCDSTVVLNLTVNRSIEVPYEVTTCDSYTWSNGVTYTQSGVYYDSLKTIHGCDSVEILTLTINYSDTAYFSATACDSYIWHDETYTTSGTYEYLTQTVNGCDSLEVLTLTINRSVTTEETYVSCDSYTWNGETYTESGDYVYTTVAANGCDSIVTLHLTILPDATTESETLALCPSELPYEWYGQSLIEAGTYSATEPYVGMECDSVIHELTLNVYVQTLPAAVTLPIVRTGEAIDVTIPTAEIQAHIAAETWYAPNALVAWYIMENSDWAALSADPVAAGITEVTLKYAVETDCGNIESDKMVIAVETTGLENIPTDVMGVYKVLRDNKIFIIRGGKAYSIMGHLVGDKSVIDPAVTIQ